MDESRRQSSHTEMCDCYYHMGYIQTKSVFMYPNIILSINKYTVYVYWAI